MKKNVFSVFSLIFFISLIKKIFSINDETTESIVIEDKETTKFSTSKDMAQCTCDLTDNVCDFRCCCDTVCKDLGKSAEWEEKGQCIDKEIDPIAIYRCGTKKENFNYNKNATKMHIKDHIHNIMCIKYDRSGEKGEFYLDVSDNSESSELKNNWIQKFFPTNNQARRLQQKTSFTYGELVSSTIYKPNFNGECKVNKENNYNIHFLKPFETSCVSNTENDLSDGTINGQSPDKIDSFGTGNKTVEITYIVNYSISSDNKYKIDSIDAKILKGESNLRHFYVKWNNTNSNNNNDSPKGYLHGKPVRMALKYNNDDAYYYNSNGFFLPISDSNGYCIKDAGKAVIIKPILYKKNLMYFCKYNEKDLNNYIIYNYFKDTLKIGMYANSKLKNNEDWIDVNNKDNPSDFTKFYNLKIKLIFATSRKSENYLNYEYIEYAKMNITAEVKESATEGKISLIVKFADVSNLS